MICYCYEIYLNNNLSNLISIKINFIEMRKTRYRNIYQRFQESLITILFDLFTQLNINNSKFYHVLLIKY